MGSQLDFWHRLEPETASALRKARVIDLSDLEGQRSALAASPRVGPDRDRVITEQLTVPGGGAEPAVMMRSYRPRSLPMDADLPVLIWIHGGGFVMGSIDRDDAFLETMAYRHGCAAISVEWRNAPEHPFPAAHDDAYRAVDWVFSHASELGIDARRVVIGGASCGAGLAAGAALRRRDEGKSAPCLQLLIYPMLDDRPGYPSAERIDEGRTWSASANAQAWTAYLGEGHAAAEISPYAAPARALELSGLPPTFVAVGDLDVLRDECVDFARRLLMAEVSTELHVYPGMTHAFNSGALDTPRMRQFIHDRDTALRIAFEGADTLKE